MHTTWPVSTDSYTRLPPDGCPQTQGLWPTALGSSWSEQFITHAPPKNYTLKTLEREGQTQSHWLDQPETTSLQITKKSVFTRGKRGGAVRKQKGFSAESLDPLPCRLSVASKHTSTSQSAKTRKPKSAQNIFTKKNRNGYRLWDTFRQGHSAG